MVVRHWPSVVIIAILVVVGGGLVALPRGPVGPGATVEVGVAGPNADEPVEPLAWSPCTDPQDAGLDCATPLVPLDHAQPDGPQIQLYVTRLPATGSPDERIGSLFVNPGGPGGSTIGLLHTLAPGFSPAIRAAYDIVSLNPRGVEGTVPDLACEAPPPVPDLTPTRLLHGVEDWARHFARTAPRTAWGSTTCQLANARTGAFFGTNQVADDLDHLRRAVGDARLTYWGISYGSRIGTVYALRHPDHVGRVVLDGVLDPIATWYTANAERGGTYDAAFAIYRAALPEAGQAFDELVDRLTADGPVPVILDGEPDEADVDLVLGWTHGSVGRQGRWRWLQDQLLALQAQVRGGPRAELTSTPAGVFTGEIFTQVECLDTADDVTPAEIAEGAAAMVEEGPLFGAMMADELDLCLTFPLPVTPIPMTAPSELPPILLVNSLHDPATPYFWAEAANGFLPGSRLLTYEGTQHGVWTRTGSSCIDTAIDGYWLDGRLPAAGTSCPLIVPPPGPPTTDPVVPDPDDPEVDG